MHPAVDKVEFVKHGLLAIFFVGLMTIAASPGVSKAAGSERAVGSMLGRIDRLSAKPQLKDSEIARRFRIIAARHLDRNFMARNALGDWISKLDANAVKRYISAYHAHMALGFVRSMRKTGASVSKVLGSRRLSNGNRVVIARIEAGSRRRDVVWYMCARTPKRVCDVEVDGIRASAREKSVFGGVLRSGGISALVRDLKAGRLVDVQ